MTEHLLFLQAAGSNFTAAHDLVTAVAEVIQTPHGNETQGIPARTKQQNAGLDQVTATKRGGLCPDRLAERLKRAGCEGTDHWHVALAVLATAASPLKDRDVEWIESVAARMGDPDALLETAGVLFAFNTINRIADARRVRLEYRFLRELKPLRGWIERRLVSLTRLAYDLSFKHQSQKSGAELLDRLRELFEKLGIPDVPGLFNWLSESPVVLEGILEMIETNLVHSRVRSDLLKEAIAIGVVSRAMPGSEMYQAVEQWLPPEALVDSKSLRTWATRSAGDATSDVVLAARRYAWQVANTAYTITDEQVQNLSNLGLSDAERLDLTVAAAVFTALAIIEPISVAVVPKPMAAESTSHPIPVHEIQAQSV